MEALADTMRELLGLGRDIADVDALQMALRAVIIYAAALVIIRLGSKRFLSQATAFDVIVAIMLGSILSRGINGSAPFLPTIVASAVLVGVHWLLAFLTSRLDWFGPLVKGNPVVLVEDGEFREEGMRRAGLSRRDLEEHLRLKAKETDLSKIRLAVLERNGEISVVPKERAPKVLDVSVEDGAQTVRVELE